MEKKLLVIGLLSLAAFNVSANESGKPEKGRFSKVISWTGEKTKAAVSYLSDTRVVKGIAGAGSFVGTQCGNAWGLVKDTNTKFGTGIYNFENGKVQGLKDAWKNNKKTVIAQGLLASAIVTALGYGAVKTAKVLSNKFADKRTKVKNAVELIKNGQYKNDGAFYTLMEDFGITDGQEQAKFQEDLIAGLAA